MARVSTYLNFDRRTEEAFTFYRKVFGTEFEGPILGGHLLMGTDAPESMGLHVNTGNNVYIMLEPDTRAETDRLFAALAEGGKVDMPLQEMFWGDYYGSLRDRFGVQWMFNCTSKT